MGSACTPMEEAKACVAAAYFNVSPSGGTESCSPGCAMSHDLLKDIKRPQIKLVE